MDEEVDGSWWVWVREDDQLEIARKHFEDFLREPDSSRFAGAADTADRLRKEERQSNIAWRKRVRGRRQFMPGMSTYSAGPLSFALVCVCIVVAVKSNLGRETEAIGSLFISYEPANPAILPEVRSGEFWRLFTPMLIHFGLAHLVFNMMWLFRLGSMIEKLLGVVPLVLLVLGTSIAANLPQYFWSGPAFGGMSGVNYGLFGYIWLRGKLDPSCGLFLPRQDIWLMLAWFLLCFTGAVGPIANAAHAGGLLSGVVCGWAAAQLANRTR